MRIDEVGFLPAVSLNRCRSFIRYPFTSFFRPPPSDPSHTYAIYVHPSTAQQIQDYSIPVIKGVLDEMVTLGHTLGFTPESVDGLPATWAADALEMTRKGQSTPQAAHRPSTMVDIEHGDPIEVEVIWGEVIRLAKERGVPMPVSAIVPIKDMLLTAASY